jgi:chromosome segregation ATPase
MGAKVERLVVENNALKLTIQSLESRDEETVATLQKENEELKTKIVELESRESQVEAGVVETLQKENEELKKQNASLCTSESVMVSQKREVKRLEHRLGEAQIVSADWEQRVRCFGFGVRAVTLTGVFPGQHAAGGGEGEGEDGGGVAQEACGARLSQWSIGAGEAVRDEDCGAPARCRGGTGGGTDAASAG